MPRRRCRPAPAQSDAPETVGGPPYRQTVPRRRVPCFGGCGKLVEVSTRPDPTCHGCRAVARSIRLAERPCPAPACGRMFVPIPYGRAEDALLTETCSRECGQALRHRDLVRGTCEICGATLRKRKKNHGVVQRSCSKRCGVEIRRRDGNLRGPQRRKWPTCRVVHCTCAVCGRFFVGPRLTLRCPTCPQGYVRRPRVDRTCEWCGETFKGLANQKFCPKPRPCSERKCAADRDRRNGRFKVAPVRRQRLYERDHYRCYLCGAPTRSDVPTDHPWAPSLDHVVPRSQGGSDRDANLGTAHRWCNVARGDAAVPVYFDAPPPQTWDDTRRPAVVYAARAPHSAVKERRPRVRKGAVADDTFALFAVEKLGRAPEITRGPCGQRVTGPREKGTGSREKGLGCPATSAAAP